MLTTARIFAALSITCTGVLTLAGSETMPTWVRLVFGAIGLFAGAVTATSGPVQNTSAQNDLAKSVVDRVKANE